MKKTLLMTCSILLASLSIASADDAITREVWTQCQQGNVQVFSDYVGAPAILVSEYQTEIIRPEGAVGLWKWLTVHHCRVVASNVDKIPFGKAVIYVKLHEVPPVAESPKGRLVYIVNPSVKDERYMTGEIVLWENMNQVPLLGDKKKYEAGKKRVDAVK